MNILNKLGAAVVFATWATAAAAQPSQQAPHPLEQAFDDENRRTEIILPQVNGMNIYKADLHINTIYSDGDVTPDMRVLEAIHLWLTVMHTSISIGNTDVREIMRFRAIAI